ncbi:hypothetical protein ACFXDJ_10880 [Streptomyces sp. NPDC059443]|uniref:hypothetical protein n=1 Tax=unclassified Streptomyces TaxID=2593676 RepID=UPI003682A37F
MTTLVGLSSGSAPALGAAELARLTLELGGTAVDVRAGKGHAWEQGGLAGLRAAGVGVCFVGIGTVLGGAAHPLPAAADLDQLEPGLPVKVFAAEGCTAPEAFDRTRQQIQELAARVGGTERVLVETHHGYAPVPELLELCERTGVRILLDSLGLARIHPDPAAAAARLAPWTSYAQVKGFDWASPGSNGHLPLALSCAGPTRELLAAAGPLRAVTVESKAGALAEDMALLLDWYAPAPAPAPASSPALSERP